MSILRKSTSQRPMLRWALVAMCVVSGAALHTGVVQAHEYKFGTLTIDHPWTRETPTGAKVAAGFVTITNNGNTAEKLVGVSAEIASRAEIHKMEMRDGVMKMAKVDGGIVIEPGTTVTLKPGGLHMMLMGLKQGPKEGERIKGTLVFETAGKLDVEFKVEKLGAKAPADKGASAEDKAGTNSDDAGHHHHH